MLSIRKHNGEVIQLPRYHPPLRISLTAKHQQHTMFPDEVIRRIVLFLNQEHWVAADSTCRQWYSAIRPLYNNSQRQPRSEVVAFSRLKIRWSKFEGFMHGISFRGSVAEEDLQLLRASVAPWKLPPSFIASLRIHDGEAATARLLSNSARREGMYLGAQLLSAREMATLIKEQRNQQPNLVDDETICLRIPLFSEIPGARRLIAMELVDRDAVTTTTDATNFCHQHGRIVLISSLAPWAPHFRVLADSWEGFLTLI